MALEDSSVFLQLIAIESGNFLRRIVGNELDCHHLDPEETGRNVHVGIVAIVLGTLFFLTSPRICRQPGIARVRVLADMNSTHRRLDIDLLSFAFSVLLHIQAAGRKKKKQTKSGRNRNANAWKFRYAHGEPLLMPLAVAAQCRPRARLHSEC